MPEIPDLNIFNKNLTGRLAGKLLIEIGVPVTRRLKVSESEFKDALEGQVLTGVRRVGKELYFSFGNGRVLGLHLMLHGTMYWYEQQNENRFTIAELLFEGGTGLAVTDWQKAVILTLDPKPSGLPDALNLPAGYLKETFAKTARPVKTVLTDGKVVQGIGNAYADEILYAAKLSPFSKADQIPQEYINALYRAIPAVLHEAEKHIAELFPDTISEKERDFLQVHRPRQPLTLKGEPILRAEIDKRKTYYTESQQQFG